MNLSGQQRKKLQNALINAFPTHISLERMLLHELDKNLREIAREGSLQDIVFQLIQAANSQGWVEHLVRAAHDENPGNQLLNAIFEELLSNHASETLVIAQREIEPISQNNGRSSNPNSEFDDLSSECNVDDTRLCDSPKKLSAQRFQKLQDALIDAFSTIPSLEELLSFLALELNKNLDIVTAEGNLATYASNLIKTADAEEWIENLIFIARELNYGNSKLRDIAKELLTYKQKVLKQKILVLITIPHYQLLDKQIQEIEKIIRQAANQNLFEICVRTAVCPYHIHEVIEKEQPQVVHLCGHGMKNGRLLLEDDEGNNKPISPESLAPLFNHAATIKCVLLNICDSQLPAEALSQYIYHVIGMNQSIKDKKTILFAEKFYSMLGSKTLENKDMFKSAFDEALNTIKLENISRDSIPVLISTQAPLENLR